MEREWEIGPKKTERQGNTDSKAEKETLRDRERQTREREGKSGGGGGRGREKVRETVI